MVRKSFNKKSELIYIFSFFPRQVRKLAANGELARFTTWSDKLVKLKST